MLFCGLPLSLHTLLCLDVSLLFLVVAMAALLYKTLFLCERLPFLQDCLEVPFSHGTEFRNDYVPNMFIPFLQQTNNEEKINKEKVQDMENSEIILCAQLPFRYIESKLRRKWPEVSPLGFFHP